jgi:hypothetical protein
MYGRRERMLGRQEHTSLTLSSSKERGEVPAGKVSQIYERAGAGEGVAILGEAHQQQIFGK